MRARCRCRYVLAAVSFELADLEPGHLGGASGSTVLIDRDAAGWGWYVDPTPADDAEFAAYSGDLRAGDGSSAEGRMDLLTVVMHELGHVLGKDDLPVANHPHDLMAENIPTGVRRLPGGVAHASTEIKAAATQGASVPLTVSASGMMTGSSVAMPVRACAQAVASTTLAVSTPANGIGGLAQFDIGVFGPVLASLAIRRRRAA